MRTYPEKDDAETLASLKCELWMIELLKFNPGYPHWGNYEDSMGWGGGWSAPTELETFADMWELDDYNEVVNFYFRVTRDGHNCPECDGTGLNPQTKKLRDDWYTHLRTDGREGWSHHLDQSEVDALVERNRLTDLTRDGHHPTAAEVNAWSHKSFGHDAINHWICYEARAKRLGVFGHCDHCDGGTIYDEDAGHVALQLWVLHPRKGASRGVYIKRIEHADLPDVFKFLRQAAERNAERFSRIPA
jgi:hypothetical protein